MARAFILGHGTRLREVEKTFVPLGRSIAFYSEVDQNTLRSNGLAALNAGDIPPVETFRERSEVDNYGLTRFEDHAIAQHMASESSLTGGPSYFIGMDPLPSPVWLCTDPVACAGTKPRHAPSCRGLFALVPEEELISVTCRGIQYTQEERNQGKKNAPTIRLGARKLDDKGQDTSQDFYKETVAEAKRLLTLSATDPAGVVAHLESLTEPTRQMLYSNYTPLWTFVEGYYKAGGASTPAAVLEARRALEALGEDSFADHVDKYDTKQKAMVLGDTDLEAAYRRSVEKRSRKRPVIGQHRTEAPKTPAPEREEPPRRRQVIGGHRGGALQNESATIATGPGGATPSKEVARALRLLELSRQESNDPTRTLVIWRMIKELPDSDRRAAEAILGSRG